MKSLEGGSGGGPVEPAHLRAEPDPAALGELTAHLGRHRARLVDEWVHRIAGDRLLPAMARSEIGRAAEAAFDGYLAALRAGPGAVRAYARDLCSRLLSRGAEIHDVMGIVLLLRDVLVRSLLQGTGKDPARLSRIVDAHEPAAESLPYAVAIALLEERERIIREQQVAIRELLEAAAARQSGASAAPGGSPHAADEVEREA